MPNASDLPTPPSPSLRTHSGDSKPKVLIVDDEFLIRHALQNIILREQFTPFTAESGIQGLSLFRQERPEIVILDIKLPDANGLALLATIKEIDPAVNVIMITGSPDIRKSVEAMKRGALDYLEKPLDIERLKDILQSVRKEDAGKEQSSPHCNFVFDSESMREVYHATERLASADVTLLVLGESGTGKSFLCKTVHGLSNRNGKPFIEIGCSNIPEHLIESELFGYEKGAFTDAKTLKKGLIETAEGGTVFFDEIGDMPYPMQSKLLSLIEERTFRRIGGLRQISADVRIIAATNRNLHQLVKEGRFRLDLFYRLNIATIELPPLRKRKDDIPLLAEHYLKRFTAKYNGRAKGISSETMGLLLNYAWPGNVRELKNLMEKLSLMSKGEIIEVDDIVPNLAAGAEPSGSGPVEQENYGGQGMKYSGLSLKMLEEESIRTALRLAEGNQRKAARLLDITRDTLRYRMKRLGIHCWFLAVTIACSDSVDCFFTNSW